MGRSAILTLGVAVLALASLANGTPARAGTFVYVSNAEDGDISTITLQPDGELQAGEHVKAASVVIPMTVSPDRRFLYAASRSKPFSVHVYTIDPATGGLKHLATSPLAESFPYISLDKTGRVLLSASYGAALVSVNSVGPDGRVAADPLQMIPVGRNAHSILADATNKFVFVPTLGTDQIFQFTFDAKTGHLASTTPAVTQLKTGVGPRHFVISRDNKFVYVLSELLATVTTLSLDARTGALTEVGSAAGLPPDSKLNAGVPRGAVGTTNAPPRNTDNDVWAADIHMAPDEKFLYISERTTSSLSAFRVDGATGKVAYGQHPHREATARIRDRPQRGIPHRLRREVADDLGLCDRPRERRAADAEAVSGGQGRQLGRDRRLRLIAGDLQR